MVCWGIIVGGKVQFEPLIDRAVVFAVQRMHDTPLKHEIVTALAARPVPFDHVPVIDIDAVEIIRGEMLLVAGIDHTQIEGRIGYFNFAVTQRLGSSLAFFRIGQDMQRNIALAGFHP